VEVWLWLLFKVIFTWKCIKIIFFLFFKNYFWYQHIKTIWKHQKYINLKQKNKNNYFFQKYFWNAKTNKVLRNSVKKICKNCFTKTTFQTQFFSRPHNTRCSLVCYQISCCVCFTANTKADEKQTYSYFICFLSICFK